jgi:serine/threonine protein kinase
MPPTPPVVPANSAATTDVDSKHDENSQRRKHREEHSKPSRSNRILGDYTLSKTLGAGSMGKVKLATHNITGEKVCISALSVLLLADILL